MEPFIGEIRAFGFGKIPQGWVQCIGQVIPVASNQALFSLLGFSFGGDGRTTFGLPDLRGRTIIGLSAMYPSIGLRAGVETVTLDISELPAHNHDIRAMEAQGSSLLNNEDDYLAEMYTTEAPPRLLNGYTNATTSNNVTLHPDSISDTGGGQPHNNMMPYQVLNWCIATTGYYPPRS